MKMLTDKIKKIRTGVIGVGSMGQNHARIYSEISDFVAVSDTDEINGRKIAEKFGVSFYPDFRDMLDHVDAVSIAVPTIYHKKVSEIVASSKKHILVEKPLASTYSDAKSIIKICEHNGINLSVGHIERHNPVVAYAKNAIENGVWGEVISMSSKRLSLFPGRIKDVGVIFDLAIHDIDIMNYLSNSSATMVKSIFGCRENKNLEDHATIIIGFENGINGICEVNWLTPTKVRKLSLTCTRAFVELDFMSQNILIYNSDSLQVVPENLYLTKQEVKMEKIEIENKEPLLLEIQDFLKSILDKRQPLVTGYEALENIRIAEEALKK